MNWRKLFRAGGCLLSAVLLFVILTILFIPGKALLDLSNRAIAPWGLAVKAGSFGKAFPIGISGSDWLLSSEKGELLKLERGSVRLRILPLLTGKVSLAIEALSGSGRLKALASPSAGGSLTLELNGLNLEQIPFFATVTGIKAQGVVNCRAEIGSIAGKASGYVKVDAKGVDLAGIRLGETPLPDARYQTVQMMLRLKSGAAAMESFTLDGEGLFVRIKGDILAGETLQSAPLEMTMELMPKPEFMEKQKFIFLLLSKYLDTPGHFQIPIKGTLGKPLMQ